MSEKPESMLKGWVGWMGWGLFLAGLVLCFGVGVQPNTPPYSDTVNLDLITHKLTWMLVGVAMTVSGAIFAGASHFRR